MRFDYRCLKCKKPFEIDVPITSVIERRKHIKAHCPHCLSKKVVKLISRPEIRFVGTGFYATDKDKK